MSELKANNMIPSVVTPDSKSVTLNERKPVSITPSVEGMERDNTHPIIVVPGVMGSKLYPDNSYITPISKDGYETGRVFGTPIWLGVNTSVPIAPHLDLSALNIKNALVVTPPSPYEYGVLDIYKDLVKRLIKKFTNRKVYFFSYDWRQSNSHTSSCLKDFINSLQTDKIDLVCHSMGGLVASSLAGLSGMKEKLDTVITLATPYEGSPNLLRAILTRNVMMTGLNEVLLFSGMTKSVKVHLPGVTQLAPTTSYVDIVPQGVIYHDKITNKNDSKLDREVTEHDDLTTGKYRDICSSIFRDNPSYSDVLSFQESISSGISNIPNSFFGIGGNEETLKALILQKRTGYTTEFKEGNTSGFQTDYQYELECIDAILEEQGDGTVPFLSANKLGKSIPLIWENNESNIFYNTNHTKMAQNENPLNWVVELLKYGKSDIGEKKPPEGNSHIDIRVACPVDVVISNGIHSLISNTVNINPSTDFGTMYFLGNEGDIKLSYLKPNHYTVQLQGTDTGTMDYSLRFFDADNAVIETRDLYNVPVTKDTHIITDTNMDEPTVLVDKKRPWEKHEATVTKNYRHTSKKNTQSSKRIQGIHNR